MMSAFPPQPGMVQHPGMPHGQPMPGGAPHPQNMAGAMQMGHPGVSGPHGQVSQAGPMMGMQPGMMQGQPNAHAMSHLAPNGGQQQMMQQGMPQQGMSMSQIHQQRLILQQRQQMMQRQQMIQQATGQPGQPGYNPQMAAALQQAQMSHMNPQMHQAAMQNLHLLHQQQQQQQQQQQALAEAARQQNLVAQQQQHAQHLAMQHAHSQGSNQGQPPQPHPGQGPMRPGSAIGSTSMEARPSPAPTAPSASQAGPQTAQAHQGGPAQAPQGPPGGQGPSGGNPPQQHPQLNNPQQSGPQAQNQAQNRANAQQAMNNNNNNHAAMAQAQAHMLRPQQHVAAERERGRTLLQAFNFVNKLGSFQAQRDQNSLPYWRQFVNTHFTDDAIYRMVLKIQAENLSKTFEVNATGLARYLFTQFETEIDQVQFLLDGVEEKRISETHTAVLASRSRMLHWLRDGSQLVWNGTFKVTYAGDKIDLCSFEMTEYQTYLPRSKLEELCALATPNQNRSPRMVKAYGKGKMNQHPQLNVFDMRTLPVSQIGEYGIHKRLQQHLELSETMNYMQPLIAYSREHPELSVSAALKSLVEQYNSQPQPGPHQGPIQGAFPPGGLQGRTPSMASALGQSPALSHAGLPNGNMQATPSPHQTTMAPPMQLSMSQQGSNASMSANTSPNVTGAKRRRSVATGIKDEDGPNGSMGGGPKVKQSPRMASGNAKRLKNG